MPVLTYLAVHGRPIRYGYVTRDWPLDVYQNVYAREPGSAEMPSAGRPFTPELVTRLVAKGVGVTPLVLHTGVSSLEANEHPYPEWYRVAPSTAARVNQTRADGGRVIAIGTTVVRALETVADRSGLVHPGEGWTDLVVTPERGVFSVDGMLTGWHEPEASHLLMLEAVAGRPVLDVSYAAAVRPRATSGTSSATSTCSSREPKPGAELSDAEAFVLLGGRVDLVERGAQEIDRFLLGRRAGAVLGLPRIGVEIVQQVMVGLDAVGPERQEVARTRTAGGSRARRSRACTRAGRAGRVAGAAARAGEWIGIVDQRFDHIASGKFSPTGARA